MIIERLVNREGGELRGRLGAGEAWRADCLIKIGRLTEDGGTRKAVKYYRKKPCAPAGRTCDRYWTGQ